MIEIPSLPLGWAVYYIECYTKDNNLHSIYCGRAKNLNSRMKEHQKCIKCKYTRRFPKLVLAWYVLIEPELDHSFMSDEEYEHWCRVTSLQVERNYKNQTSKFKRSLCRLSGINVRVR